MSTEKYDFLYSEYCLKQLYWGFAFWKYSPVLIKKKFQNSEFFQMNFSFCTVDSK